MNPINFKVVEVLRKLANLPRPYSANVRGKHRSPLLLKDFENVTKIALLKLTDKLRLPTESLATTKVPESLIVTKEDLDWEPSVTTDFEPLRHRVNFSHLIRSQLKVVKGKILLDPFLRDRFRDNTPLLG